MGEFAEEYCALRFMNKEYEVYKNWVNDGTDLLVMKKNKIRRIQVKCSKLYIVGNRKAYCFQVKRKRSKESYEVNYFAFVGFDDNFKVLDVWIIPKKFFDKHSIGTYNLSINPKDSKEKEKLRTLKKFHEHWVLQ